jgi:hypothetical protein
VAGELLDVITTLGHGGYRHWQQDFLYQHEQVISQLPTRPAVRHNEVDLRCPRQDDRKERLPMSERIEAVTSSAIVRGEPANG